MHSFQDEVFFLSFERKIILLKEDPKRRQHFIFRHERCNVIFPELEHALLA